MFFYLSQIANHPLLVRRIYTDADVESLAKALLPRGIFGFECTLERIKEELMSYNDYALHRVSSFCNI
jgi:SWI/SNF-related matrix-associated actin-dependent regulator 1 of chromatin subfamily A